MSALCILTICSWHESPLLSLARTTPHASCVGVALHRVAHGLCIEDALHDKITFSTVEMAHNAQEGYTGFWGYFTLKENPTFDPKDTKSSKYMRHYHVKRSDILVYNVQV